jgi:acyl-CoA reductase-like NAD-dependent aldehyde dehydrogenase
VATASLSTELESFSPATGERLGAVPITAPEGVQAVVDGVAKVQRFWAQLTLEDRARYLERAAQLVIDEADEIRDLLVREQGKPRNEAFSMELLPTIDALRWIAGGGPRSWPTRRSRCRRPSSRRSAPPLLRLGGRLARDALGRR